MSRVTMPADPPFIVANDRPFKVEATPSKMGGVDALAKRPLDMSGKADPMAENLEAVPAQDPHPGTWVTLPPDTPEGQGGEGPLLEEQIDTTHREYFDDPSRYLRTDVMVRLPGTDAPRDEPPDLATTHQDSAAGGDASPASTGAPLPALSGVVPSRGARATARQGRAARPGGPAQDARAPRARGEPSQRRDAFNERLAGLMARQQKIHDELSAVEQAVQATRSTLEQGDPHDKPV